MNFIKKLFRRKDRYGNLDRIGTVLARAREFPPAIAPLFSNFSVASVSIIDWIIGAYEKDGFLGGEYIRPDDDQFLRLFTIGFWTFLGVFLRTNEEFRSAFSGAAIDFVGLNQAGKKIIACTMLADNLDLSEVSKILLEECSAIVGRSPKPIAGVLGVSGIITSSYKSALDGYWKELGKLKNA
jgi:hypothetical protein